MIKEIAINNKVFQTFRVASFDVDAEKCFTPLCPDELPVPGGHRIVEELNKQARFAWYRIGCKDAHPANAEWKATPFKPQLSPIGRSNMDVRWNMHGVPGTKGFQLLDGLPDVTEYTYFVWKGIETNIHPYGACYHDITETLSTGVIEYLKSTGDTENTFAIIDGEKRNAWKNRVELVIVGGLALDFCVKLTVLQLLRAGFYVAVNLAACRALSSESEEAAMDEMKKAGAMFISSADAIEVIS